MILTYKIRHGRDFSKELSIAHQIAELALKTRTLSTKNVKQYGLKSAIANQILREYSRNKKLKIVGKVNLIVPNQSIKLEKENREFKIPCLKLILPYQFPNNFSKINQIELDGENAFISVTVHEPTPFEPQSYIGVDRNTKGHIAVVGNPKTGEVMKLGKSALHVHGKYKAIRKRLQKKRKLRLVKKIRNRESRIVRDLNHKISKAIVQKALSEKVGIKLEKLEGIRENKKHGKKFNYALHSWSFYQLQQFIEYKARLRGVPIAYVEPRNTSKECSRCGSIGSRLGKKFSCLCGHVDNADVNASFNIALRPALAEGVSQLNVDRDAFKGSTDTPKGEML